MTVQALRVLWALGGCKGVACGGDRERERGRSIPLRVDGDSTKLMASPLYACETLAN
jgi:hypothetical protein